MNGQNNVNTNNLYGTNNISNNNLNVQKNVMPTNNQFSVLDRYGEDSTKKTYITNPAIARENEIRQLIITLLTPDRSAVLVGKAGIGKTAIVEGLAYLIQLNQVPDALKGYSIISIATSALLGESKNDGQLESRALILVQEVMKRSKLILFIDEIHTVMGAGSTNGNSLDLANILKPALARGDIKLIGATTQEEYERYMIRDRAFIRRFEKIDIYEPDADTTLKILIGTIPKLEKKTGVKFSYTNYIVEKICRFLINMTSEYKRIYEVSSRYPDIALSLLSKIFSYAIFDNSPTIKIKHVWMAINNCNTIYPDTLKKEIVSFKNTFDDILKEENVVI